MVSPWSDAERKLLVRLDAAVRSREAVAAIGAIAARVEGTLARDVDAIEAWEPIPLSVYGGALPTEIQSSWVFILRGAVTTGAERHPNSHQRMTSWRGGGDFQVNDEGGWRSHVMRSDAGASLEERWISIPPNTWHQGLVGEGDWVVVSFHTVPAAELIEERPGQDGPATVRARKYLEVPQA